MRDWNVCHSHGDNWKFLPLTAGGTSFLPAPSWKADPLLPLEAEIAGPPTHLPRGEKPHRQPKPGGRVLSAAFPPAPECSSSRGEAVRSGNEAKRVLGCREREWRKASQKAPPWEVPGYLFLMFLSLKLGSFSGPELFSTTWGSGDICGDLPSGEVLVSLEVCTGIGGQFKNTCLHEFLHRVINQNFGAEAQ